jgi:hypothetical protein
MIGCSLFTFVHELWLRLSWSNGCTHDHLHAFAHIMIMVILRYDHDPDHEHYVQCS